MKLVGFRGLRDHEPGLSKNAQRWLDVITERETVIVPDRDPATLRALQELFNAGLVEKVAAFRLVPTRVEP